MRFITYQKDGAFVPAILSPDGARALPFDKAGIPYDSVLSMIKAGAAPRTADFSESLPTASLTLSAPIPFPDHDVICLGINYAEHAEESARYKKEAFERDRAYPVYFSKRVVEAVGDGARVPLHADLTQRVDYEAELAVVLGKTVKNVPEDGAEDCVFGYTILNDVSARDVQTRHKQWYFGKSFDGFTVMGPALVTRDEIGDARDLAIRSRVNGELRQDSRTSRMIFGVAHVISELSRGMTLTAGTVISMGTPAGVGMGFDPPRFLRAGDEVTCEIEKLGALTCVFTD